MGTIRAFVFSFLLFAISVVASAQPVAPSLSSRPGAAYTLYLNFSGFNFTGNWGSSGQAPGNMSAYRNQTGPNFTAAQQAEIRNIWSRVAESYNMFNVNVTTVDPAVSVGGLASSNYQGRQQWYDQTARVMHAVIGNRGNSGFFNGAGGVSYVDVWRNSYSGTGNSNGIKTNWTFPSSLGGFGAYHNIFTAATHEVGHAAGLSHQGDYTGSTQNNAYSTNNGSSTLAPFMGVGYSASRNTWSVGRISTNQNTIQNDALRIRQNSGMGGFINDGIGRSIAQATPISLSNGQIKPLVNQGVIVPVSDSNPNPIGSNNYTRGYFSFETIGGLNTITVNAGTQWLQTGVADPHRSLDATLRILDALGNQVAISATSSLSETIAINLAPGLYYIEVSSAGGKNASLGPSGTWAPRQFYDMGAYFLTGTILAIPEPTGATLLCIMITGVVFVRRRNV
jgi:hypothetical protein